MTARTSSGMLCRLLVVLSEGHDVCCFTATERNVLEICEIGEQGVSTIDSEFASKAAMSECISRL